MSPVGPVGCDFYPQSLFHLCLDVIAPYRVSILFLISPCVLLVIFVVAVSNSDRVKCNGCNQHCLPRGTADLTGTCVCYKGYKLNSAGQCQGRTSCFIFFYTYSTSICIIPTSNTYSTCTSVVPAVKDLLLYSIRTSNQGIYAQSIGPGLSIGSETNILAPIPQIYKPAAVGYYLNNTPGSGNHRSWFIHSAWLLW